MPLDPKLLSLYFQRRDAQKQADLRFFQAQQQAALAAAADQRQAEKDAFQMQLQLRADRRAEQEMRAKARQEGRDVDTADREEIAKLAPTFEERQIGVGKEQFTDEELRSGAIGSFDSSLAALLGSQVDPHSKTGASRLQSGAAMNDVLTGLLTGAATREGTRLTKEEDALRAERYAIKAEQRQAAAASRERARQRGLPPINTTEQAVEYAKRISRDTEEFQTIKRHYVGAVSAIDAAIQGNNPAGADFALIKHYGQMVEPGSIVRNEEGEMIATSGASKIQKWVKDALGVFNATGILPPDARIRMAMQIEAEYEARLSEYIPQLKRIDREARANVAPELLDIALPENIAPAVVRFDRAALIGGPPLAPPSKKERSYAVNALKSDGITDPTEADIDSFIKLRRSLEGGRGSKGLPLDIWNAVRRGDFD